MVIYWRHSASQPMIQRNIKYEKTSLMAILQSEGMLSSDVHYFIEVRKKAKRRFIPLSLLYMAWLNIANLVC